MLVIIIIYVFIYKHITFPKMLFFSFEACFSTSQSLIWAMSDHFF